MDIINGIIERSINYLTTISINDIFDILIVAFLIYRVIFLIRKTNSYNLAKGIVILLVIFWLSEIFKLTMIQFLIKKALEIGAIAIVILFQPELRKFLERVGRSFTPGRTVAGDNIENIILQVVLTCYDLSSSRTGALIIFERNELLTDIINTGTTINADVNSELLKNIFFDKAPLHDGAVIIKNGKIAAAGCVLPLTKSSNLSKDLGMRHRAGIGLSEQSDALVIIVSEESGAVSVAIDGMLKRHLTQQIFEKLLRKELSVDEDDNKKGFLSVIKKILLIEKE